MLAAVIEGPGAVVVRFPPGGAAQVYALAGAAQTLADMPQAQRQALAASERPEQLKIVLDVARP